MMIKQKRKYSTELITKEQIEAVYFNSEQDLSVGASAKLLGCGRSRLIKLMKIYDLQAKSKTRKVEGSETKWPQLSNKTWLIEQLKTKTYQEIADMLGTTRGNVGDRVSRFDLKIPDPIKEGNKKHFPTGRGGENASRWKGGRKFTKSNGGNIYMYIYSPDHPNKSKSGYVLEHRLAMEKKLGRFLNKMEVIHHIDHNTLNNDITNLQLFSSQSVHTKMHRAEQKVKLAEQERLLEAYKNKFGPLEST